MKIAKMPDGSPEIYDAVQGEGATTGKPMAFVRLSMCNLTCSFCLVGGTQIKMSDGTTKSIEKVVEGDSVLSFNPETKEFETDIVTVTMDRMTDWCELIDLVLADGSLMQITKNHEVYTTRGWVKAGDLLLTDEIAVDT